MAVVAVTAVTYEGDVGHLCVDAAGRDGHSGCRRACALRPRTRAGAAASAKCACRHAPCTAAPLSPPAGAMKHGRSAWRTPSTLICHARKFVRFVAGGRPMSWRVDDGVGRIDSRGTGFERWFGRRSGSGWRQERRRRRRHGGAAGRGSDEAGGGRHGPEGRHLTSVAVHGAVLPFA